MNKINLSLIAKSVNSTIKRHSSEILTGIGIAGMISTTVLAVRATPKALLLLEKQKALTFDAPQEIELNKPMVQTKLPLIDIVKSTWKCYIPAAVTGSLSILCLIGASSVNAKRNTALAAACTLSETAFKDYQEKVVNTIGEKKERSIIDAIAKDKLDQNPVNNREVIITEKGSTLCYDVISGRYFKSNIDELKKAAIAINRQMLDENFVSINDFYYEIGLPNIKMGDDLGWNIDSGYVDFRFSSQLADDGTPCLVLDYSVVPQYGYC